MEVLINGIRLHYTELGNGPAVLFVHAFPFSAAMWHNQMTAVAAAGFRAIAPDLRGFGQSEVTPAPVTMAQHASDLLGLLDHLKIDQAAVCGLSMGGYISFEFWRQAPQRVRSLILADTRAGADGPEAQAARETNAQLVETQGSAALAAKMLPNLFAAATPEPVREAARSLMVANAPAGIAAALRGMAQRPDSFPTLATISVPTLVIVGAEDSLTPPSEAQAIHADIANSRLVTLAGAGHMANLEQPEGFGRAVNEFLGY